MQTLDYIKVLLFLALLFGFAPCYGFLIRNRVSWQRGTFFAMCFLFLGGFLTASEWGFTIHSLLYRGTARGFHVFWADIAAASLIWAHLLGNWRKFKFFPPGFWLWIAYCFMSLLSLFNAPAPIYSFFAAFKAFKILLIFVAAYNFIKTEDDLRYALRCMAWVMFWQLFVVLKQKYVDHIYQVWGTFEHQNSLCMFAILIGMVFLAVAMGPKHKDSNFFLVAFIGCAVIVQSTLSRGGLAMFAMGTVLVVLASLLDRPTKRRILVVSGLSIVAAIGLAFTLDTITARLNDYGNEESKNTRDMLNVSARMMLADYPMGIGWNNFAETINRPFHYGDHIDDWQRKNGNPVDPNYKKGTVESLWWLLLSETGYQGFLAYLTVIAVFFWWNIRNAFAFRQQYLGAVSIGILVGCTMNYAQSLLERVLTQPKQMMLWFLLAAVTARIMIWRKDERKRRRRAAREQRERLADLEYEEPALEAA